VPFNVVLKQAVLEVRDPRERLARIAAGLRAEPMLA